MSSAASRALVGVLLATIALAAVLGTRHAESSDAAPAPPKRFPHTAADIEDIAFRDYPFLRAVECAIADPDLDDGAMALAMTAWEQTVAHMQRLQADRVYRAIDTQRRAIAQDRETRDFAYTAFYAEPYILCVADGTASKMDDLAKMTSSDRIRALVEHEVPKQTLRSVTEKATVLQQLYAEFLRRYQEPCDLRPLMDEFGGRADLPPGKRSFKDGCPLTVWVFPNGRDWDSFRSATGTPLLWGYFNPGTGWVYLRDEEDNRQFEVHKTVRQGAYLLEHWFQKQKREWGQTVMPPSFFGEGFAEYLGAVTMDIDRKLTFHGINVPRIAFLKREQEYTSSSKPLPVFQLRDLVGFEGYGAVERWGEAHGMQNPLSFFYAQSWALVYFLNEFSDHKYQTRFNQFLNDMLSYPPQAIGNFWFVQFKKRLNIRSDADWSALEKEFGAWYTKDLLATDLRMFTEPPPLERWYDFTPLRPIDPRDPTTWGGERK